MPRRPRRDSESLTRYLHLQTDRSHELERICAVGNARGQLVVEIQFAGAEAVAEMHVRGFRIQCSSYLGQCEIVRGDESDGAAGEQAAEQGLSADAAVVGVGAGEQLVEQKEGGLRRGDIGDLLEALDLCVEA